MNKFENKYELPEEVREYLEKSFDIRKNQFKEDLNKYLNTLPEHLRKQVLDDIYNWNITK